MAQMSAVAILFSLLLLVRRPGGEPHPCSLLGGTMIGVLLWLLEGCEAETRSEPTPGYNTFTSSSKSLDKDFANIFDEILLQVLSKDPHNKPFVEGGTAVTGSHLNENDVQPNSLKSPEFSSSSKKRDDHLAKLFDEILLQVLSKDPHNKPFVEGGTAVTGSHLNKRASDVWNSPKTEYFPVTVHQTSDTGHIAGERRNKQSLLFNRGVPEKMTTVDKDTLQGTVSQDARNKNMPCGSLLSFLQRNIIVSALAAAAILAVTVMLLLMLATYIKRKQPLYPPANMTYNIFIMNGKTWWQKSQGTNLGKIAEKQKQVKCDSCV